MVAILAAVCRFLDGIRRVILNVLFYGTLAVLAVLVLRSGAGQTVPDGALLQVNLTGNVKEAGQLEKESPVSFSDSSDVQLHDVLDALKAAQTDTRISGVLLRVGNLDSAGLAAVREIGAAIDQYRAKSGKKVWVWETSYTQSQFLIAAHADHVGLHPMGQAILKGLSSTQLYWGKVLERLGLEAQVHKAGAFKSAPELLTSDRPSQANLYAQKGYMDEAWHGICERLEARRGLMSGQIDQFVQTLPEKIKEGKPLAEIFHERGLIDAVETEEAFEGQLAKLYTKTDKVRDLLIIDSETYLADTRRINNSVPHVAVVIAEGEIASGNFGQGISPEKMAALIDEIDENDQVKALVLRINSPGGDAVASEMIRDRLNRLKTSRRIPVIVSMGNTAASGGYWIATAGDKIVADPASVTGSVGVFAMTFRAEGLRNSLEVGRGGYRTSPIADLGNPVSPGGETEDAMIDNGVNRTYRTFKSLVSVARGLSLEQVEKVAQGRVWMGTQAVQFGLADQTGGYYDALDLARRQAGLTADAPAVIYDNRTFSWKSAIVSAVRDNVGVEIRPLTQRAEQIRARIRQSGSPTVWAPFEPTL